MWWRDFGLPGLTPSPFFHSFCLWREATGLYWVFNQMCKMQSSSFQGTVPLICPIWHWRLYVVSFHPRGGRGQEIWSLLWNGPSQDLLISRHGRSSLTHLPYCVLYFLVSCRRIHSSSRYIRVCPTHAQILWASPTVLALRISIKSTKSACVCLFAKVISPCRARLFACVCEWVCQLWFVTLPRVSKLN